MAGINIIELYNSVFSYKGLPFPIQPNTINRVEIPGGSMPGILQSTVEGPYFMPIKIDGWQLPNEPLVGLSLSKKIERTFINGRQGTVKELISNDDYIIQIKGICVNEDSDDYPEDQVSRLREICEKSESLSVTCELLRIHNISNIVINNYKIPADAGAQSYQKYTIEAFSDNILELVLKPQ